MGGRVSVEGYTTDELIQRRDMVKAEMETASETRKDTLEDKLDLLEDAIRELASKGGGTTVVNNVSSQKTAPPSGGGATMIPLVSSSHGDPTKIAYQVSYRPAG